jgi:hypothetical protein
MKTFYPVPPDPSTDPVYLTAAAVHSLIHPLPSGTAFCIGVVLLVMMTGRLVQTKGSLARAVLPFVVHLRWGWHRVERAMERGTFSLDAMCDRASDWCLAHLPLEPVRLGREHREVNAIDSSTIARLRAGQRLALAGKGYGSVTKRLLSSTASKVHGSASCYGIDGELCASASPRGGQGPLSSLRVLHS